MLTDELPKGSDARHIVLRGRRGRPYQCRFRTGTWALNNSLTCGFGAVDGVGNGSLHRRERMGARAGIFETNRA
jgi:hypothetical protein